MMWNYRTIITEDDTVAVHEVYYNEAGAPWTRTEHPISLDADNIEDLQWTINRLNEAMQKPPLHTKDFEPDE